MSERDTFLKYGEHIILRSPDPPSFQYLMGRSLLEENIYFIKIVNDQAGITYYDNFSECIFQIIPKQRYEAVKNLKKFLKKNDSSSDKLQIINKRVENEKELNQSIIKKYKGKPVALGDEVHLLHVISQCYAKCIKIPNLDSEGARISPLCLTKDLSSSVIFEIKIDPYFTFKKDGEKITYEDKFFFENCKMKSSILKQNQKVNNLVNKVNLDGIHFPSTMENNLAYDIYKAGHQVTEQIQTFQAIKVSAAQNSNQEDQNIQEGQYFHWGDFVHIKHILKNDKNQQAAITCQTNVNGWIPQIYMNGRENIENDFEKDSICSIFQIVPEDVSMLGQGIKVNKDNLYPPIMFRHWLTGKFLNLSQENMIQQDKQNNLFMSNSVSEILLDEKLNIPFERIDQNSQKSQKKKTLKLTTFLKKQRHTQDLSDENKLKKYLQYNRVMIQSAQSEEQSLTTKSCFAISEYSDNPESDQKQFFLHVQADQEVEFTQISIAKNNQSKWLSSDYFQNTYFQKENQLKEFVYGLERSEEQDFFFLEFVKSEDISDAVSVLSMIEPFMKIINNPDILNNIHAHNNASSQTKQEKSSFLVSISDNTNQKEQTKMNKQLLEQVKNNLISICFWLCDISDYTDNKVSNIKESPNPYKQKVIRNIGFIDMIINILFHIEKFDLIKKIIQPNASKNDILFQLVVVIIQFLQIACKENEQNSFFINQWYNFLKLIVLNNQIPVEIQIDQLLIELFSISNLDEQYKDDVGLISKSLEFERYNIQALKLLLVFCGNYDEKNLEHQKYIINQLFNQNRDKLFRQFFYDNKNKKLGIKITPNDVVYIDNELEHQNTSQFLYIETTLQLSSLVCKGESNITIKHIQQLCPILTCIQSISDKKMHLKIRAIFIELFKSSYLKYDSRYVVDQEYPYNLTIQPQIEISEKIKNQIKNQRHQFHEKYCNITKMDQSGLSINLKDFLFAEFIDLKQGDTIQFDSNFNHLIQSLLDLLQMFFKKNFFNKEEIFQMHTILDEILKNSFVYLYYYKQQKENSQNSQKQQGNSMVQENFDIKQSLEWIIKTLEVIYYIEMYEQNKILNQFFTLERSQELFRSQVSHKNNEKRQKLQQEKSKHVVDFMTCLEIPDTEVIYYYLRWLVFNSNDLTQTVVKLIYQIFNMKANILMSFNNILYINEGNIEMHDIFYELYFKIHLHTVDLKNIQLEEEEKFFQNLNQLQDVLISLCKNIYDVYNDDSDTISQNAQSDGKILSQPDEKNQLIQEDESLKLPVEKGMKKFNRKFKVSDSTESIFTWNVFEYLSIDIRNVQFRQDIMRNLNIHKLLLNIIKNFCTIEQNSPKQATQESILSKSLISLIYFCINNIQNSLEIAHNPDFKLICSIILNQEYQNKKIMRTIMVFICEIFRDNYHLLINFQKDQDDLFQQLSTQLTQQIENYDYCVYYFQLLQYFFTIGSAQLIQNQLWTFEQISQVYTMQPLFQSLLKQCLEEVKEVLPETDIVISDKMLLFCNFLNLLHKIMQNSKHKNEAKQFFNLEQIKNSLKVFKQYYFLKQIILQFMKIIYIQNKKLDENEVQYVATILFETLKEDLQDYLDNFENLQSNKQEYINNKPNIFKQSTSYSSTGKLIHCKVYTSILSYIYYGIIETYEAYRDRFLKPGQGQYNEQDFQFMEDSYKLFIELFKIWKGNMNQNNLQLSQKINLKNEQSLPQQSSRSEVSVVQNNLVQDKEYSFKRYKDILQELYTSFIQCDQVEIIKKTISNQISIFEKTDSQWTKLKSLNTNFIDEDIIEKVHNDEVDKLIALLVRIREQNVQEFKTIIENLIKILTEPSTQNEIRKQSVTILRNLANFRLSEKQQKFIRNDLCELGYTNFLCQVISNEKTDEGDKLEYIESLIDFLDEGEKVQENMMEYLKNDSENCFILQMKKYIQINFNDFKVYEKGLQNQSGKIQEQLRDVIDKKIQACNQAIGVFKMSSEGHFTVMQNYLREQIINGRLIKENCNLVKFAVKLFGEYISFISPLNVQFGENILDFLIEVIQGPCIENQQALCNTQILENLEDLMLDFVKDMDTLKIRHVMMSQFTKRIYIFILSLFEGNQDKNIIYKIENYLNPMILLKRLKFIYQFAIKIKRNEQLKLLLESDEEDKGNKEVIEETPPNILINGEMDIDKNKKSDEKLINKEEIKSDIEEGGMEEEEEEQASLEEMEEQYGEGLDSLIQEGEQIYILLRNMKLQSETFKQKFKKDKKELMQILEKKSDKEKEIFEKSLLYYKLNTGRLEIINNQGVIQFLFFPIPDLAQYLSESTQQKFLEEVNRETPNEKINGLLYVKKDFIDEMKHFKFLMANVPFNLDITFTNFRWIVLLCAFVINFLLLFDYFIEECDECKGLDPHLNPCVCDQKTTPTFLGNGITVFGIVLFAFNVFTFVLWACLKLKLDLSNGFNQYENEKKLKERSEKIKKNQKSINIDMPIELMKKAQEIQRLMEENLYKYLYVAKYLALNSYFLYLSLYAAVTIMGILFHRLFFTLLLLDIIERSAVLQNVIKSISINSTQLIMTGLLGLVVMFIYGMLGYYEPSLHATFTGQDYSMIPLCVNAFNCFLFVCNIALRSGGGIGDPLNQPDPSNVEQYVSRFFYDMTFFLMINVIWMNVIFGIIIDTFASLREVKNEQDAERRNKCFICSLERTVFEKKGIFFVKHTEQEHNVWNYFFYTLYLEEKEQIDYNGTESDIQNKINNDDISWFPIGKAQSLIQQEETETDKGQDLLNVIQENIQKIQSYQNKLKTIDFSKVALKE